MKFKPKFVSSPGKIIDSICFEQTANKEYIAYDLNDKTIIAPPGGTTWPQWETLVCSYVPLSSLPWRGLPMPQPYENIDKLYSEIREFLYDHIDFMEDIEYDIAVAWIMHTWRMENWNATPYLFFFGPAASGKTWTMEVLGALSYRPMLTFPSSAALYRTTEEWHPTLFLDEVQIYLMRTERAEIINYLNAGYRRGQTVIRMEENPRTKRLEPIAFRVFGAKCLAGTENLLETLRTRCIIINMSKAARKVSLSLDANEVNDLLSKLLTYRFDSLSDTPTILDISEFMKQIELTDGRLIELIFPLHEVAPDSMKNRFITYLNALGAEKQEEEALSLEAIVFAAVLAAHKDRLLIPLSDVTHEVNEAMPPTEWLKTRTVGAVIMKLGFKKRMYKSRTHMIWDDKLVARLLKRYPIRQIEPTD